MTVKGLLATAAAPLLLYASGADAQASPDTAAVEDPPVGQALDTRRGFVSPGLRRLPRPGIDPFRYTFLERPGVVVHGGAAGSNNALNLRDIGALIFLEERDSLRVGELLDAMGLVPQGRGLRGGGEGGGGLHVGLTPTPRLSLGVSAAGRGHARLRLDDDAVALLRDGNSARQDFSLGRSEGAGLVTVETGVHALYRLGPREPAHGRQIRVGAGVRHVRPLFFVRTRSLLENGGFARVTGDSIRANLAVETAATPEVGLSGSGSLVADLVTRVTWSDPGVAVEAALTGLGSVGVPGVERETAELQVSSTRIDSVADAVDDLAFTVRDTADMRLSLPRSLRIGVGAWPLDRLQFDAGLDVQVGGDLPGPPATGDLLVTWRPTPTVPLRGGFVLGGDQGLGYRAGAGLETERMLVRLEGQSLGGLFRRARGVGARLTLGLFF